MIDLFTTLLAGGATGLVGTVFSKVFGFFESRQAHAQAVELAKIEAGLRDADREATVEIETRKAQAATMRASYKEAVTRMSTGDSFLLVISDFIKSMVRPSVTYIAWFGALVLFLTTDDPALKALIVNIFVYLWASVTLWWFGIRAANLATGQAKVIVKGD